CLNGDEQVTRLHLLAGLDVDAGDRARHWSADMVGVSLLRLWPHRHPALHLSVGHPDDAWLTVQFEEGLDVAGIINLTKGEEADLKRLARIDFNRDFLCRLHAVKEGLCG